MLQGSAESYRQVYQATVEVMLLGPLAAGVVFAVPEFAQPLLLLGCTAQNLQYALSREMHGLLASEHWRTAEVQ